MHGRPSLSKRIRVVVLGPDGESAQVISDLNIKLSGNRRGCIIRARPAITIEAYPSGCAGLRVGRMLISEGYEQTRCRGQCLDIQRPAANCHSSLGIICT